MTLIEKIKVAIDINKTAAEECYDDSDYEHGNFYRGRAEAFEEVLVMMKNG